MEKAVSRTYAISGFHCSGCADNLGESLGRREGVIKVDADYEQAQVEVRFDPERISEDDIREQIHLAGFEALERGNES